MSSERFLVTGALGCVGSWAVKRLLEEGVPVWTYDLPGDPHRLRLLLEDEQLAAVSRIDGDITDARAFEEAIVENGITHVVHLAALQVPFVRTDPIRGARVNVVGTTVVFEAVKRHVEQIRGLAYASSVGVYGSTDQYPPGPLRHDAPHAPPNLYGVFKQANEGTARIYWAENQVRSVGLRPYVVYGPGRDQGWTSAPSKAMLAAAAGRSFHVGFGGAVVYHHADETARVFLKAARTPLEGAPVFNIGGVRAAMGEIVQAIEAAEPRAAGTITFDPIDLPHPSSVDDSELQRQLGPFEWMDVRTGVARAVGEFRELVDAGRIDVERGLQ